MFGPDCDKAAHPDLVAAGSEAFAVLIRAVSDCAARGLINPAEVQQAALAGWALSHGLASLHADGILAARIPADPRVVAPQLLSWLIDGLQAGAQGGLKAARSARR